MESQASKLRPMGLTGSLLSFGLPALLQGAIFWVLAPRLDRAGLHPLALFALMGLPLVGCLAAAMVLVRLEGFPFRERLRLGPMGRGGWMWVLGLALGGLALYLGGVQLVNVLLPNAEMPPVFTRVLGDRTTFLGFPLKGSWWLLGVWFLFYLVNVLGEELWFRGAVLPRQELAFGRWTWALHGVLWAAWHASFFAADALVILPQALAYAWVTQRTRSTWPALAAHGLLNSLASLRLIAGIMA